MMETAVGQHPLAVILSCIDSRTPAEIIFDLGLGDIFSIRVAGNVISPEVLGSAEYGCAVAGAKLLLVLGHTQCGAVTAAVHLRCSGETAATAYGCDYLDSTVREIQHAAGRPMCDGFDGLDSEAKALLIDRVARLNVLRSVEQILIQSRTLRDLERDGQVVIQAAMYDIANGTLHFLSRDTDG
jgi:carbonic anhydrase/SulP family sulfate permease